MNLLYGKIKDINRDTLLSLSDSETKERALAAFRESKGLELALGRYLARRLAANMYIRDFRQVSLCHDSNGRPFFSDLPCSVSISHSDGIAVALVHSLQATCDLQGIRHFPGPAVRGFFSQAEYREISASCCPDLTMTRLFCRRECLVKWVGHRPETEWDAEQMREQNAPNACFQEIELEGKCLCVLGPREALHVLRIEQIG